MRAIILLQWQRLRREPFLILSMLVLTVVFVLFMGGTNANGETTIPSTFSESMTEDERIDLLEELNQLEGYNFVESNDLNEMEEKIALGEVAFGLSLETDGYTFLIATDTPNQAIVDQHLQSIYREKMRIVQVMQNSSDQDLESKIQANLETPPILVEAQVGETNGDFFVFDNQLQSLFGMTLFFAIYTIVFSLSKVAEEKQLGSWNRIIISPTKKWQVYSGYLSYAFIIGFIQIFVVFFMFDSLLNFDLGNNWWGLIMIMVAYTFAICALGLLLLAFVSKTSQLNAVVPIVAVSMAMLGGAYWPIEIVDNPIVLQLSNFMPIMYAMDALKEITIYQGVISDIIPQTLILVAMGIVMMGVGIPLMEKR